MATFKKMIKIECGNMPVTALHWYMSTVIKRYRGTSVAAVQITPGQLIVSEYVKIDFLFVGI